MALSGCGASATTTTSSSGGTGSTATPAASGSNHTSASATPVPTAPISLPGDTRVSLSPQLYPAGSDCAGVAKTEPTTAAPSNCTYDFLTLSPDMVPGQADVENLPMPAAATITKGVAAGSGQTLATAFYVDQAIRYWAIRQTAPAVITAVDGPTFAGIDPVAQPNIHWTPPPACLLPTSLRVSAVAGETLQYLSPGTTTYSADVVVATYPACGGLQITGPNTPSPTAYFAYSSPTSYVYLGAAENVSPFTPLFIPSAVKACGARQLVVVCGG